MTLHLATGTEPAGRWRMHRLGILNFWYYDEEVFELEDGRLILRGANGSGKSVTMQSFLPLVLDGDKRPHRLDPFGSRDRRIEYYLLGEADSGKTDVTGYLWMEFANPAKGLTKTIGIGLRARRGAAQVQFWGFLLDDGRRIGHDFWLYDRNHMLEHGIRVPLGRKDLEKEIGAGGQVVHDQSSYRDMVNKQLFGFADAEAFQDLLHLLIQLRSPKLSKDFKPSAIYEILHGSLPPLHEDDLRPLSEVLEDMDQIADRLDELRLHMKELDKLQEKYDRYNQRMLYDTSVRLIETNGEYDEHKKRTAALEAELAQAEAEKQAAMQALADAEEAIARTSAELDVLEKHEAIGKQRELEAETRLLEVTENELKTTNERLRKQRQKLDVLERDLADEITKHEQLVSEQRERLDELDTLAEEIEFSDHAVYSGMWHRGSEPSDGGWREPWLRDLKQHRLQLEAARDKAREEQEAGRRVQDIERELGEARRERDERERERDDCSRALEEVKDALREEVLSWKEGLQELPFDDERVRETFAALTAFGPEARSPEAIRVPMRKALDSQRERLAGERVQLQHEKKGLEHQQELLIAEKRAWETERDPEPPRSEARMLRRAAVRSGEGAPLYAVCDFRADVDEARRAQIEEALERAGLLDAWIAPDGRIGGLATGQEEVWIVPQPIDFGYTLADVLTPSPSEESGLREETIDAVLRTFLWVEDTDVGGIDGFGAIVSGSGAFRLGPLVGRTGGKTRAAYIGKETRRRTRLLEIARLERELAEVAEQLADVDGRFAAVAERERCLAAEVEAFPNLDQLEHCLDRLSDAASRLEAALQLEGRVLERFKAKSAEWRELQRQLSELTADWTRLKREKDLDEAVSLARDYEAALGELNSAWQRGAEAAERIARLREERQSAIEAIEDDETWTDELDERRRTLRTKVETLERLIAEQGLADIFNRIAALKTERERLTRERKRVSAELDDAKEKAAEANAGVRLYREQEAGLQHRLDLAIRHWQRELRRNLVAEWREAYAALEEQDAGRAEAAVAGAVPTGTADRDRLTAVMREEGATIKQAVRLASEIRRRYDSAFAGKNAEFVKNALHEQFNEVRSILADYVLESDLEEETGRILITSKRDRAHPQTPSKLLEELRQDEEQQRALLSEKDRELYEEIILRSVGKAIRQRIHRAESWVKQMNRLMEERNTSSGLQLKLGWEPKAAQNEQQMDTAALIELLKRDSHRLRDDEIDAMTQHFRSQIGYAKQSAQSEKESLRKHLYEVLDYRNWFQFELRYRKGGQTAFRPLTDSRFNVLSGGEKAMAMYIPLFAAAWSRYSDARPDAPRLISLDEAFAGVDEENMRDMFQLLTEMGFDYIMTSQVLWGCYDTVPRLAIYEIYRPKDVDFVTLFHYRWNGKYKEYVQSGDETE